MRTFKLALFSAAVVLSQSVLVTPAFADQGAAQRTLTLSTDNDLFAPTQTDQDYTAGVALTYSGPELQGDWNVMGQALDGLNGALFGDRAQPDTELRTFEFGAYGFTPEDITIAGVTEDDRPYSSLVYVSVSNRYKARGSRNGWTSSLTVGALGLDLFKAGQNAIHPLVGSEKAEGWGQQVSEGGELTARYSLAYHQYLDASEPDSQFKLTYFGSAGYLTEAGVALVFRDGLISSPDNRFNPELSTYGERTAEVAAGQAREDYFWGGIAFKLRAYNAFLEGQFRDSEHTINRDNLNIALAEAWLGYTHSFSREYKLSYVLRVQSSEIKRGRGDRTLAWGGLVLTKTFQ